MQLSKQYFIDAINMARNAGDKLGVREYAARLRLDYTLASNEVRVGGVPCEMKLIKRQVLEWHTPKDAVAFGVEALTGKSLVGGLYLDASHVRDSWNTVAVPWLDDAERLAAFDRAKAWLEANTPKPAPKLASNQVLCCGVVHSLCWHYGTPLHKSGGCWDAWIFGTGGYEAGDAWFRANCPSDRFVMDDGRVLEFRMREDGEAEATHGGKAHGAPTSAYTFARDINPHSLERVALYRFRDAERAKAEAARNEAEAEACCAVIGVRAPYAVTPKPCTRAYAFTYPTKPKHGLLECTCAAESVLRIEGDLSKVTVTITPKANRK